MLIYTGPHRCRICNTECRRGPQGVTDRVYGVRGSWDLKRCNDNNCAALFLDSDLTLQQLTSFYESYSTHSEPVLDARGVKLLYRRALMQIWHAQLGYPTAQRGLAKAIGRILGVIPYFREEALSRVFWLKPKSGGSVIEVGFGNAQGMSLLREAGWAVRGSEMDEVCVSQARSLGFDVVQGNFADGLFEADAADAIVASHVIEHLPSPGSFMSEAYRVLRPGGRVVLRTPNAASHDARRFGSAWRGLEVPRHLCIQTPGSLARMAKDAGFVQATVFGTPLGGYCAQQSSEILRKVSVSRRQGKRTLLYNVRETVRAMSDTMSTNEIVLSCMKPTIDAHI